MNDFKSFLSKPHQKISRTFIFDENISKNDYKKFLDFENIFNEDFENFTHNTRVLNLY